MIGNILTILQGKKTYFALGFGICYIVGAWLGLWPWDNSVAALFGFSGIIFKRMAITQVEKTMTHILQHTANGNVSTTEAERPAIPPTKPAA